VSSRVKTLTARSISKTIAAAMNDAPFRGRVWSSFPAACNLVERDRVVSLVTPAVGDGPLNVVVESQEPFTDLKAGTEAMFDGEAINIGGHLKVNLQAAEVWNPLISWPEIAAPAMLALWEHLREQAAAGSLLTVWIPEIRPIRGVQIAFHETARGAAERLLLALQRGDQNGIIAHTSALAGLGAGATPAGDDFLMGLMAGLRAWPQFLSAGDLSAADACAFIVRAAAIRTHVFSTAHLRAAQAGEMSTGWHRLAAVLATNDGTAIQEAVDSLLAFGSSSGADALAGFVGPYLMTEPDKI